MGTDSGKELGVGSLNLIYIIVLLHYHTYLLMSFTHTLYYIISSFYTIYVYVDK